MTINVTVLVNEMPSPIVEYCVGGDRTGGRHEEFEALFNISFSTCVTVAGRIVVNAEQAEDIATEAFTRAWARWWWLKRQPSPLGWLVRVTTNLALDHVRRTAPTPYHLPQPPDAAEAVVLRRALVAALVHLPERQRAAIALRYLADLTERDVALAMGVSVGSVKTYLHRGLARLHTTLDDPEAILGP